MVLDPQLSFMFGGLFLQFSGSKAVEDQNDRFSGTSALLSPHSNSGLIV